jgi:CBS domain-containing protein
MDTPLSVLLRHKADKLADTGSPLYWVGPQTSAAEAAQLMDESNVGCVLIMDHGKLAGIFGERDLLRGFARHGATFGSRPMSEVMTHKPFTVPPSMTVEQALVRCTDRRVRHLPVVDGEELLGLISIGDLVSLVVEDKQREIANLMDYIHG